MVIANSQSAVNPMYRILLGICVLGLSPIMANSVAQSDTEDDAVPVRMSMTELIRIGSDESPESVFFGDIAGMAVNSEGHILVSDCQANTIHVFSDAGRLLMSVGREGEGPGEFYRVQRIFVGPTDTLYAMDGRVNQLEVFDPGTYDFNHSVRIEEMDDSFPAQFLGIGASKFLFVYRKGAYTVDDTYVLPDSLRVMSVGRNGIAEKQLFSQLEDEDLLWGFRDGRITVSMRPVPFGRRSLFRLGSNGLLYAGRTDSIRITIADLTNQTVRVVQRPHSSEAVTRAEIEEGASWIQDSAARQRFADAIPDTKPAIRSFIVDDKGRIWLKTSGKQREIATWTILNDDGSAAGETGLPAKVGLWVIRAGRAYAVSEDESGADIVVVYEIGNVP